MRVNTESFIYQNSYTEEYASTWREVRASATKANQPLSLEITVELQAV